MGLLALPDKLLTPEKRVAADAGDCRSLDQRNHAMAVARPRRLQCLNSAPDIDGAGSLLPAQGKEADGPVRAGAEMLAPPPRPRPRAVRRRIVGVDKLHRPEEAVASRPHL